jgi:alpha-D-ribose 1-methylphosphonate 5-phosphate C-P lyase
LNIQANLLNFGVQTRIALSEMILTTTGLLALAALQGMLDKATVVDQGADATTPTV